MFKKWITNSDDEVKKRRAEEKAFFKRLDGHIDLLKANANLAVKNIPCPEDFELVQSVPDWSIYESLQSVEESLPLRCYILRYTIDIKVGRSTAKSENFYLVGLITLKRKYPHTIMYPESLAEKLSELFVKTEVDFAHSRKFSRRFYTLTKDEGLLKSLLYDKDLNRLSKFKTLELELKDNFCIFRPGRKSFEKKEALAFGELSRAIHQAFD